MIKEVLVDQEVHFRIQRFLFAEAHLLDNRDFEKWLDLFTADCRYWVPNRRVRMIGSVAGDREIDIELGKDNEPYIYNETLPELKIRVTRAQAARQLWSENPPSLTRRIIGNIEAWEGKSKGEYKVVSAFSLFQARFDEKGTVYFGERHDTLRQINGSYKIAFRKVILDCTVLPGGSVTVFF